MRLLKREKLKQCFVCLGVLTIAPPALAEGVFGISKGDKVDSFPGDTKNYEYKMGSHILAPKPHPLFPNYTVTGSKNQGVCQILAEQYSIPNPKAKSYLKDMYKDVSIRLISKYGEPVINIYDAETKAAQEGLLQDSWAIAFMSNEFPYMGLWHPKSSDKSDDIDEIVMYVTQAGNGKAWLSLRYRFDNFSECVSEITQKQDEVL